MDIKTVDIVANRLVADETNQLLQDCELVADTKPAIDRVLKADGRIIIDSKEPMEDRINYKGRFIADVLYMAKGDKSLHSISGEAPINDFADVKGAREGMNSHLSCNISNIDYNIVNDRKVNVQAMADIYAGVSERIELEGISELEDLPKEQQKFTEIHTTAVVLEKRDKFSINEDITLPAVKLPINEVLTVDANIVNPEFIPSEDSVNVRGDISVTMLYTATEGSMPEVYEFDIPFDGSIDAEGTKDDMNVNGTFFIDNLFYNIDENDEGENRIIDMEITVGTEFQVTDSDTNQVLEDAYSVNNDIKMDIVTVCTNFVVCRNKSQYPVKEVIALDESAPDMLQIFKTGGKPYIDDIRITDNKVIIEGVINADIMYVTGDDTMPVYSYRGVIPFSQAVECRGAKEGMKADVTSAIAHIGFNMLSDREVEVRCALNTNTVVTEEICYDIPVSADIFPIDEEILNKIPGIVIYVVKKGDTLWKLAKRFNSTVEDIAEINNIENPDLIYPGQRFIILKKSA